MDEDDQMDVDVEGELLCAQALNAVYGGDSDDTTRERLFAIVPPPGQTSDYYVV